MNKEEIYKFNDFVISYDKGFKDRSALIISKIDKINIYILGELYDESADIVNTIINNLQQENQQLKDNWNKLKEFIKSQNDGGIFSNLMIISDALNKMQELESGDSDE